MDKPNSLQRILDAAAVSAQALQDVLFETHPTYTFYGAISKTMTDLVLAERGEDIDVLLTYHRGLNCFHEAFLHACERGNVAIMAKLFSHAHVLDQGNQALARAVYSQSLDAVNWVLERSHKISSSIPLREACVRSSQPILDVLSARYSHQHKRDALFHALDYLSDDKMVVVLGKLLPQMDPDDQMLDFLQALIKHQKPMNQTVDLMLGQYQLLSDTPYAPVDGKMLYSAATLGHVHIFQSLLNVADPQEIDVKYLLDIGAYYNQKGIMDVLIARATPTQMEQTLASYDGKSWNEPARTGIAYLRAAHDSTMIADALRDTPAQGMARGGRKM